MQKIKNKRKKQNEIIPMSPHWASADSGRLGSPLFQPATNDCPSLVNLAYPSRQMAHKTHKSI
jgi:hypothetical protein